MYAIEKNVPMITKARPGRKSVYPFREMKLGDSFAIPTQPIAKKVAAAASHHARRYGKAKFSVCKHKSAWRCWRVK